ncbi:MAG: DUF2264 domain-containing protein [Saprospiraceae bacterium]
MLRRRFLRGLGLLSSSLITSSVKAAPELFTSQNARMVWLDYLQKLSAPLLQHLAANELKQRMPLEGTPKGIETHAFCNTLEGFGRLMTGIAPWLQLEGGAENETVLREQYFELALQGLANSVNPAAADYMPWGTPAQPLVDASFLALGLIRCPKLWEKSDVATQQNIINAFLQTRNIKPYFNNWLLFSAMIEAFFIKIGADYDKMRIDYALRQHEQWYKGDGVFGDGPEFHWDYYNSFVIQPYLFEILQIVVPKHPEYALMQQKMQQIQQRYAAIQERMIHTDGSFPVIGRSMGYRAGCFHHLATASYYHFLPNEITPAQIRDALTAVIIKTTASKDTFDKNGWLRPGLAGFQTDILEDYVVTGSAYLCAAVLLPLGLPATDAFWSAPPQPWTAQQAWNGKGVKRDTALKL